MSENIPQTSSTSTSARTSVNSNEQIQFSISMRKSSNCLGDRYKTVISTIEHFVKFLTPFNIVQPSFNPSISDQELQGKRDY